MEKPFDPHMKRIILGFEDSISELESLYSKPSVYAFDSMIADACDFLIQILDSEYLNESPEDMFGDEWKEIQSIGASVIEKRNAYHKELRALSHILQKPSAVLYAVHHSSLLKAHPGKQSFTVLIAVKVFRWIEPILCFLFEFSGPF